MRRLPPPSAATLPSAFVSFLVHAGVVLAGLMVMPLEQPKDSVAQMIVVPVELVTVADMTNLTAVSAMNEDKPIEEEVKAEESNPAAGAPPPDEDSVSFEPPKDKPKEETKKPEVKASPAPPAKSFNSELDDILSSVDKTKPKQQTNSAGVAPAASDFRMISTISPGRAPIQRATGSWVPMNGIGMYSLCFIAICGSIGWSAVSAM